MNCQRVLAPSTAALSRVVASVTDQLSYFRGQGGPKVHPHNERAQGRHGSSGDRSTWRRMVDYSSNRLMRLPGLFGVLLYYRSCRPLSFGSSRCQRVVQPLLESPANHNLMLVSNDDVAMILPLGCACEDATSANVEVAAQ